MFHLIEGQVGGCFPPVVNVIREVRIREFSTLWAILRGCNILEMSAFRKVDGQEQSIFHLMEGHVGVVRYPAGGKRKVERSRVFPPYGRSG